jgi:hypothetical protein
MVDNVTLVKGTVMQVLHPTVTMKNTNQLTVAELLVFVALVVANMGKNATLFPSPFLALADLDKKGQDLAKAEQAAQTKAKGTRSTRDKKRRDVIDGLKIEVSYCQTVVNDHDPVEAEAIAKAAGFEIKAVGKHDKLPLDARPGKKQGSADLAAKAGKHTRSVVHEWQVTLDGGKTFQNADATPVAHTTIENLPVGTTVGFRHRRRDSRGPLADWSQTVTLAIR